MANINKMCCDGAAQAAPPATTASDMGHTEIPKLNGGFFMGKSTKKLGDVSNAMFDYQRVHHL